MAQALHASPVALDHNRSYQHHQINNQQHAPTSSPVASNVMTLANIIPSPTPSLDDPLEFSAVYQSSPPAPPAPEPVIPTPVIEKLGEVQQQEVEQMLEQNVDLTDMDNLDTDYLFQSVNLADQGSFTNMLQAHREAPVTSSHAPVTSSPPAAPPAVMPNYQAYMMHAQDPQLSPPQHLPCTPDDDMLIHSPTPRTPAHQTFPKYNHTAPSTPSQQYSSALPPSPPSSPSSDDVSGYGSDTSSGSVSPNSVLSQDEMDPLMPFPSLGEAETIKSTYRGRSNGKTRTYKRRSTRTHPQLWEFLLDTLSDSNYNPTLIKWLDKERGIFKFIQNQQVAKLWGSKGNRSKNMTYEYLSRALRHYYKKEIMIRVPDKRLTYQFLKGATNWYERSQRSGM